jgi:purine nucleosidase
MTSRLFIDTDCGIDDAVALWWALTEPSVDVVGITTVWGNVSVDLAAANVFRILEAADHPEVPVWVGADAPFGPRPDLRRADFIHGADGVGDTGRPQAQIVPRDGSAVDGLRAAVDADPGAVTIVTIGPLTNVANVIRDDPSWAMRVHRLVIMGGAFFTQGNAMPVGEANIANDPTAAATVLAASWSVPPLLVGLDVTHQATLTDELVALADEHRTPAARYLAELLHFYRRYGGTFCVTGEFPMHDALAVMAAVIDGIVTGPILPVAVETGTGPAQGMTVADRRQPFFERVGTAQAQPPGFRPCQVATDVDVARFRAEIRGLFGG